MEHIKEVVFKHYKHGSGITNSDWNTLKFYDRTDSHNNAAFESHFQEASYIGIAPNAQQAAIKKISVLWKWHYKIVGCCDVNITMMQEKQDLKFVKKILELVVLICKILHTLSHERQVVPNLNILLIDIDVPKIMSMNKTPNQNNVNTGLTYGYTNVIVYRREEMAKVLIHELVHAWRFELVGAISQSNELRKHFGIQDLNFNEAYVDSLAMLINCYICCKTDESRFRTLWNKELKNVIQKAICIGLIYLNIYGHNYTGPIKEDTNTMSYYVVKAMLLTADSGHYWNIFSDTKFIQVRDGVTNSENNSKTSKFYNVIESQCMLGSTFWKSIQNEYKQIGDTCRDGASMRMSIVDMMKSI